MAKKKAAKKKAAKKKVTTKKAAKKKAVKKKAVKKTTKASKKAVAKAKPTKKTAKVKAPAKVKSSVKPKASESTKENKVVVEPTKVVVVNDVVVNEEEKPSALSQNAAVQGEFSRSQIRSIEKLIQAGGEWEKIAQYLELAAKPYSMGLIYQEKTAIMHPTMGLGYVLTAENNRIRVYFKDGYKNLIMNYRG